MRAADPAPGIAIALTNTGFALPGPSSCVPVSDDAVGLKVGTSEPAAGLAAQAKTATTVTATPAAADMPRRGTRLRRRVMTHPPRRTYTDEPSRTRATERPGRDEPPSCSYRPRRIVFDNPRRTTRKCQNST